MIIGSYERDSLSIPKDFKEVWGRNLLLATSRRRGEKCMLLFPDPEAVKNSQASDFRFWGSVKVDTKGRIRFPQWIIQKLPSHLKTKKGETIVVIGCLDHIEVWKKEVWEKYQNNYNYMEILEKFLDS